MATSNCPECDGTRLRKSARTYSSTQRIEDIVRQWGIASIINTLDLTGRQGEIAEKIIKEIRERFTFLVDVGLNYLSLNRSAETLSGGEAQRIRLASQIGAGLVGVMYILDEPSIGLHQRDNERLLKTLIRLRDLGNTVIVVEHDEEAIAAADYIVDIGPGAGIHGGEIVARGSVDDIRNSTESTLASFSGVSIEIQGNGTKETGNFIRRAWKQFKNCRPAHSTGSFYLYHMLGSGKSTLINETSTLRR